jgi:hypothetical protein
MRLFISYARVDRTFCIQIADTLDIHDIWFDDRLYAGQDWWKEILRRLDWCEGFVYLLSPNSVASDYCRQEYEIARDSGRHIFPVLIDKDTPIPEDLRDIQYADLSGGLTTDTVKTLLNAIYLCERNHSMGNRARPIDIRTPESVASIDVASAITKAAEAMEKGNFDRAVYLLQQVQEKQHETRFISLGGMLKEAEFGLKRQTYLREASRDYKMIAELVKRRSTRKLGCQAFGAFQKDYPDYDPENLAHICGHGKRRLFRPPQKPFKLPLLEWCEVPEGILLLSYQNGNGRIHREPHYIEHFDISKYPVTNQQYQIFVEAEDGYCNSRWWSYSPEARYWRQENPQPQPPRFKGLDRPRESVTWYEAMAFCRWLSTKTGLNITLPTTRQWRRAAQGDDGRLYPWGNKFLGDRANTRESKIRMTTMVMRYELGISPFGAFDMAGNVWEWCLDAEDNDAASQEGEDVRAIYGGSFISDYKRAQSNFHFNLNPEYFYATIGFRIVTNFF